jgi:hypothetical protein
MKRIAIVASITAIVMAGGTAAYSTGSISGDNIKSNSIDGSKIENGSVASADIKDASLTGTDLKDGSVASVDVADGALTTADIKDGTLTGADIKDGSVDGNKIALSSIRAGQIQPAALLWIEQQANLLRGGKTGIVAYASSSSADLQPVNFVDGNNATVTPADGDYVTVMTATFTTSVPVKVSLQSGSGREVGFCIADPAGFGVASCSITTPGAVPFFEAITADGADAGALHPSVNFALIKVA